MTDKPTDRTPAEEMRAAAKLLRETIKTLRYNSPVPVRLAEPLAALLEDGAEIYEFGVNGCSEELRDRLEPNVRATVEHELAVARVLNGGEPGA